ncbi:LysR family transcriptional regulator [Curvibacter sp. HBC61]|uniref:LysR family transcriptional regulator n=1 Tax=Curvibacter cyanobacteriorum TaxID=3026422 RepID=A0ABT5MY97_9BURK|nr:LysR family transcriptional regulator [Curvibacter sp. HBC61]MDD0837743.1 LysR family transcriptional regulator [Curvibacter sp. HBC61]
MRFKKLDLNLLVALEALLTERNVTRAGERLALSQSATSNALARLRQYFNDELLVSVRGKLELTPRAEVLHEAVRDLLLRIDTTVAVEPEFDPRASDREFTLFVSDYSMEVLIPRVLALAARCGSRIRLRLKQQAAHPYRSLEHGEADFLIIPGIFCSPDHPQQKLFADHFVSVVWKDSPLAVGELTLERYLAASHVDMQPSDDELPVLEHWFTAEHRMRRRVAVSSHNFVAIPHMVVGSDLIGTVHSRLAQMVMPAIPVVVRPVPLPMMEFEQTLQWHKYRSRDPGLIWLRSLLVEAASELATPMASPIP